MHSSTIEFADLFKKYRLKSEFPTLSSFGTALADKGFAYEDSIFSHWQKGTRFPQSRIIALKVLEIFVEKKAITTIDEANGFLKAANQIQLSDDELLQLPLILSNPVFQAPNEIANFNAREEIIERIVNQEQIYGKVIFIHGSAGVGKTALAIKLAHLLKEKYKDGVFWYKIEEDNLADILHSIARTFDEDIGNIKSLQVLSAIIRSLLSNKQVLLVLDSAELHEKIEMMIPTGTQCTTVLTSQKIHFTGTLSHIDISLTPFTQKESLNLFQKVLQNNFVNCDKDTLIKLSKRVGNLPLGVHLLARQIHNNNIRLSHLSSLLERENTFFSELYKGESKLYTAIAMTYQQLEPKLKTVLLSASIFKGKDFSVESIAYINGLTINTTTRMLQLLVDLSLLEHSSRKRLRIHPAIQQYIRKTLNFPRAFYFELAAASFFIFFTLWWLYLQSISQPQDISTSKFTIYYGIIAFYGALCGFHTSLKWGGLKTLMGKSIFLFSVGLFLQATGQLLYSYYILFLNIELPYPSIGDLAFHSSIIAYILGVLLLARASGIDISKHSPISLLKMTIIPVAILLFSYTITLNGYHFDWESPIKTFLDFAVPFGQTIYVSLALITFILTRKILDGIMTSKALLVLLALVFQYVADWTFIYQASRGTWIANGINDYMFLTSYFVMTLALLSLKSILVTIKTAD